MIPLPENATPEHGQGMRLGILYQRIASGEEITDYPISGFEAEALPKIILALCGEGGAMYMIKDSVSPYWKHFSLRRVNLNVN